jgi:hypothetical protein
MPPSEDGARMRIPRKPTQRWSRKQLSLRAHWRRVRVFLKRDSGSHKWCAEAVQLMKDAGLWS